MRDQNEFMRQMLDLVELARTNENRISKEQVDDFCQDMKLQKSQLELVYEFLEEHHIEVQGVTAKENFEAKEGKNPSLSTKDSQYLTVYRRELRELEPCSDEERQLLYERLLAGEAEVSHRVVESHLQRVVTLAAKYRNRGVPLEDLIQEGNLSLLLAVEELCGNTEVLDVKKELDRYVKARLIELADEQMASKGMENTIVAKTNLIHEATKVLAEEWGRLATLEELADYTKMPEEEISMYVDLALEEIHIGKE